ncbi:MAG: hypothetical protein M1830_007897 [Pleopsidium flavum]|nr:MAG: hypothetical protein M1830_007897 [Pleopsidium flavum]
MVNSTPDKRLVYLHCRSIFSGTNAQLRRPRKVRQLLTKRKESVKILTYEFPLDAVCAVAKELLDDGIFESEPRAKLHFPELFETSEARSAERQVSEAEAARSEAEAVEEVMASSDEDEVVGRGLEEEGEDGRSVRGVEEVKVPDGPGEAHLVSTASVQVTSLGPATIPIPSLHPVYLPYKTQHRILTTIQSLLEECCFKFGEKWLRKIIAAKGWEGPESVELNRWTKIFAKHAKDIPADSAAKIPGKSWKEVLFATNNLRRSAVHRLWTSATGILNLIGNAATLAKMLNDTEREGRIDEIREGLIASIEEVERNTNLLESRLSDELKGIARRRAELDNMERMAVENMMNCDKDHRMSVGLTLEDLLVQLEKRANDGFHDLQDDVLETRQEAMNVENDADSSKKSATAHIDPDSALTNVKEAPSAEETFPAAESSSPLALPKEVVFVEEGYSVEEVPPHPSTFLSLELADDAQPAEEISYSSLPSPLSAEAVFPVQEARPPEGLSSSSSSPPPPPHCCSPSHVSAEAAVSTVNDAYSVGIPSAASPISPPSAQEASNKADSPEKLTVALNIVHSTTTYNTMVLLDENTRSSILRQARSYIEPLITQGNNSQKISSGWQPKLRSVLMDGSEIDLSTYDCDDLSFLLTILSRHSVPRFMVQISTPG